IEKLAQKQLLTQSEAHNLTEAYRFFRKIEHHLQLEDWRQTHLLPEEPHKLQVLSRKMGFDTIADFETTVRHVSTGVRSIYQSILSEETAPEPDPLETLLTSESLTPELKLTFSNMGFKNPAQVFKLFSGLFSGTVQHPLSSTLRKSFRAILPQLLEELQKQPSPDEALALFTSFVKAYGSPQNLYSLFQENTSVLALTVQICGKAPLLAKLLTIHPELFTALTTPETLYEPFDRERYFRQFQERLSALPESAWIDPLHASKRAAMFQIGVQFLAGIIPLNDLFLSLSNLAGATLELALSQIAHERQPQTPFPAAIIGLGKLGSLELNFGSDLDVVFLTTETEQPSLQEQEAVLRELIARLNQISPTGQLYKIDVRLRPEGAGAPLLISLDAYQNYLLNRAELWERQMLLKSRWIAGNPEPWKQLSDFIRAYLFAPGLSGEQVDEIFAMLEKIHQKSRKKFSREMDLKNSPGGIVDIEFLVQLFQLKYGNKFATLQSGQTPELIEELGKLGLFSARDARRLRDTYLFYRRIETYLHIGLERPRAKIPLKGEKLEILAKLMDFRDGRAFLDELKSKLTQTSDRLKSFKTILKTS
ncbi:MAG: hypothetical protein GXO76_05695, partial [Calditrichaeota bacterium]|nr:hypothetical protein [Calditrichota bacterium]